MINYPNLHILMPTYNVAPYIQSSLSSIINQDYSNLTTIIVDDGSLDSTQQLIKNFLIDKESFQIHFDSDNKGIATRREQLIDISNQIDPNAYFIWLDADDTITDDHFVSKLVEQMSITKADICLYNFSIEFEIISNILLQKNAEGLIKDKINSEKILSYIINTKDQLVSVDNYPEVVTYSSLGWTKAYSPIIKNYWPKSDNKYLYEDFAYMAALFSTDRITAFPPNYKPIKYLRRTSSLTGQRTPEHFYIDVINQLLRFKKNLGVISLKRDKAANEFIYSKLEQYEYTLKTLINSNTQGFSDIDLEMFQKAKYLFI